MRSRLNVVALLALFAAAPAAAAPAASAPPAASASDEVRLSPFASLSIGFGMARDDIRLSDTSGILFDADLNGLAALGPVAGVNVGLDLRYRDLFAGARIGYQRSWLKQGIDATVTAGESLRVTGSLDESLLLLGRIGWTFSSVPVYLTGGWAWSSATSSITATGLPTLSDKVSQDGGVVGVGAQPSLSENWFLELEYLVVLYRKIQLSTLIDPVAQLQVGSVAGLFTVSVGYRL